jgi:hypothetical protein
MSSNLGHFLHAVQGRCQISNGSLLETVQKVVSATFFYLTAQFTDQDVSGGHHILVLCPDTIFFVLLYTLWVYNEWEEAYYAS